MSSCAIEVKRQVWQHRPKLFAAEVQPRLLQYVKKLREKALSDGLTEFDKFSSRMRRDTPEVKELLKLIGRSVPLYNETLRAVRTHFIETGDPGCCALRTDLLMALSDAGISSIVKRDPLQQFVECLIVCVTDRGIDAKKAATLSRSLEAVDVGPMIGDIGMVILDPCIQLTLVKACYAAVKSCVDAAMLPAKSRHLKDLTRILTAVDLGEIRRMMRDQSFERLDVADARVLPWFYPTIAAAMVEDKITATMRQRDSSATGVPHSNDFPAEFIEVLKNAPALRAVVLYYAQDRLAAKDIASITWAIPIVADTVTGEWVYVGDEPASFDEQFVRSLTRTLSTTLRTHFAGAGEIAVRLMGTFFVPRAQRSVAAHVDAVTLAQVLRRESTESNTAAVEALIETLCAEGLLPAADADDAALVPKLTSLYQGLADALPSNSPAATAVTTRLDALSQF